MTEHVEWNIYWSSKKTQPDLGHDICPTEFKMQIQGQLMGMALVVTQGSKLGLMLCCHHPEILNIFNKGPIFHFALSCTNYVSDHAEIVTWLFQTLFWVWIGKKIGLWFTGVINSRKNQVANKP